MDFKQFGSQGHKPGTCHTKAVVAIQVRTVAVLVVIPAGLVCIHLIQAVCFTFFNRKLWILYLAKLKTTLKNCYFFGHCYFFS